MATLRARLDSPIDLLHATHTLDGSPLAVIAPLHTTLHSKTIRVGTRAQSEGPVLLGTTSTVINSTVYAEVPFQGLGYDELQGAGVAQWVEPVAPAIAELPASPTAIDPVLTALGGGNITVEVAFDYELHLELPGTHSLLEFRLAYELNTSLTNNAPQRVDLITPTGPLNWTNDYTASGSIQQTLNLTLSPGQKLWFFAQVSVFGGIGIDVDLTFSNCNVFAYQDQTTAPSQARAFWVHEALARLTESLTDGTLPLRSAYFGRTDSQPTTYAADGCGARQALSTGLLIRGFPDAPLPLSLGQLFDDLQAIHALGMGLRTESGQPVLRIEPLPFFYDAQAVLLTCDAVRQLRRAPLEDILYQQVQLGYRRWESESFNGLDEINTRRTWLLPRNRTHPRTLTLESELVTSGYAIELTRRKDYLRTATEDFRYDNDTFLLCLRHPPGLETETEQDERFGTVTGVIDPSTMYNLAVTPARNLLRWLPLLSTSTRSSDILRFASGAGNYAGDGTAPVQSTEDDDGCCGQGFLLREDFDLSFADHACAKPLFAAETVQFEYPLSPVQYAAIRANPYGVVRYSQTAAPYESGFIHELSYDPVRGLAEFTLLPTKPTLYQP
jgi:hypothetical protein